MLARTSYDPSQIATARAAFAEMVEGWRSIAARSEARARAAAEEQVFAQMLVALEGWFVHRARAQEGKDGNALNEVRLLALGVTQNSGRFPEPGPVCWRPEQSLTGLRPGDPIRIRPATGAHLASIRRAVNGVGGNRGLVEDRL